MPEEPSAVTEERVVRRDPAALVMRKTRVLKEDGRELIFFEFVRPEPGAVPENAARG